MGARTCECLWAQSGLKIKNEIFWLRANVYESLWVNINRSGIFLKKFWLRAKTCEAESPHTLLVFEIFFKIFVLGAHTLLLQDLVMLRAGRGAAIHQTMPTASFNVSLQGKRWLIEQDHTRATFNSCILQWSTWQQCQISTSLHSEQCPRLHSESNNTSAHVVASQ